MKSLLPESPPTISARLVANQEGVLALVAIVALGFRQGGPLQWLRPKGELGLVIEGLGAGIGLGLLLSGCLWLIRKAPAVERLEQWLVNVVGSWSLADGLAVALISGLAEEALFRALLQPLLGLLPASILFAALHAYPDRRLWFWPLMALAIGCVFGALFERYGYPAAALAHAAVNAVSLIRLSRHGAPCEKELSGT